MTKKICILLVAIGISICSVAQQTDTTISKKELKKMRLNSLAKQEEEGVVTYKKHFLGGVKLTTDGYGGFLEIGRARSIRRSILFQLDITERKNSKEDKIFNPPFTLEPYIYGKINYFYPVKLGMQLQYLLGNKGNKNGVQITGNVGGGLSLGLLRPYQIRDANNKYISYSQADSAFFLSGINYGAPNLGTGWNKLKVEPGVYIKPAIRFDYGRFNELIGAIEVGMTAEYYSKKIQLLANNEGKNFFFSAYAAIIFGKRKN